MLQVGIMPNCVDSGGVKNRKLKRKKIWKKQDKEKIEKAKENCCEFKSEFIKTKQEKANFENQNLIKNKTRKLSHTWGQYLAANFEN